jgi:hypothetical protein
LGGIGTTRRGTGAVILLIVLVLVAGILAAVTYEDDDKVATTPKTTTTTARPTTTGRPTTGPASSTSTSSTLQSLVGSSTTSSSTTTTVEPAVPTPEQAATGLFAAYRNGDRSQAATFATEDVIAVMFAQPYSPPDGTFQGCRPDGDLYQCSYVQGTSASYDMTAQRNPQTNSFLIVVITVRREAPTTTAPETTTTGLPLPIP